MARGLPRGGSCIDQRGPAWWATANGVRVRRPEPQRAPSLGVDPGCRYPPASGPAQDRRADLAVCRTATGVMYQRGVTPQEDDDLSRWHALNQRYKDRVPQVVDNRWTLLANGLQKPRANGDQEILGRVSLARRSGHERGIVARHAVVSSVRMRRTRTRSRWLPTCGISVPSYRSGRASGRRTVCTQSSGRGHRKYMSTFGTGGGGGLGRDYARGARGRPRRRTGRSSMRARRITAPRTAWGVTCWRGVVPLARSSSDVGVGQTRCRTSQIRPTPSRGRSSFGVGDAI